MSSQSGPPGHFDFLVDLPGEIRNDIYKYALSEETPLQFVQSYCTLEGSKYISRVASFAVAREEPADRDMGTSIPLPQIITQRAPETDANQLKYVNKQLYHETRGVGLWYNDIKFHTVNDLASFIRRCPDHYNYRLRVLELDCEILNREMNAFNVNIRNFNLETVFDFCRRNPHIQVLSRLRHVHPLTRVEISEIEYRLRGTTTFLEVIWDRAAADPS